VEKFMTEILTQQKTLEIWKYQNKFVYLHHSSLT
jgi:hypothetical protein